MEKRGRTVKEKTTAQIHLNGFVKNRSEQQQPVHVSMYKPLNNILHFVCLNTVLHSQKVHTVIYSCNGKNKNTHTRTHTHTHIQGRGWMEVRTTPSC